MKKKHLVIVCILLIAFLGLWRCTDIGLGYETTTLHSNSSYQISEDEEVTFEPSTNHVIEYVVGKEHSRTTSAHGYVDHILIEFKEIPDTAGGDCKIIRATRIGYGGGGPMVIRSLDDVWIQITKCDDHFHIKGAIKLTRPNAGNDKPDHWDLVYISSRNVKE